MLCSKPKGTEMLTNSADFFLYEHSSICAEDSCISGFQMALCWSTWKHRDYPLNLRTTVIEVQFHLDLDCKMHSWKNITGEKMQIKNLNYIFLSLGYKKQFFLQGHKKQEQHLCRYFLSSSKVLYLCTEAYHLWY